MSQVIYKYPVTMGPRAFAEGFTIRMPRGASLLDVQTQRGEPMLWALVDPHPMAPIEDRRFVVLPTGQEIPDSHPMAEKCDMVHVGTFQLHGGALVFHLFELEPRTGAEN